MLQSSHTTDLKLEKLLSFFTVNPCCNIFFAEHVVKSLMVSFQVLYFMLNPMDKLFTVWKSYFIVIFTDKSKEVTLKWFWCMRMFNPSAAKGIGTHIGYRGGGGRADPPGISWLSWPRSMKFLWGIGSSLPVSKRVKLTKYLLFCHHGNHSITRCFSWLLAKKRNWKQPLYKCL